MHSLREMQIYYKGIADSKIVIIDTSSIIYAIENNIKIDQIVQEELHGYKPYILMSTIRELKSIAKKGIRRAIYAKAALSLIRHLKINIIKDRYRYADRSILKTADMLKDKDIAVLTNDTELYYALKDIGVKAYRISRYNLR
ncbi:MAG: hypothetical protein ARM1_0772 [Candidatus Micrarchaeota archaeon]|nr:MAG: hypothetical protein ARM1_0772 [Candidatus Micrarchaeota archaeon]